MFEKCALSKSPPGGAILQNRLWGFLHSFTRLFAPLVKMADKGELAKLPLREVKLYQLPRWMATGDYRPSGIMRAFWRGVDRYNAKYVNVVKGRVTPVAHVMVTMLVVSYIWRFKGEKHHRLRKHHW